MTEIEQGTKEPQQIFRHFSPDSGVKGGLKPDSFHFFSGTSVPFQALCISCASRNLSCKPKFTFSSKFRRIVAHSFSRIVSAIFSEETYYNLQIESDYHTMLFKVLSIAYCQLWQWITGCYSYHGYRLMGKLCLAPDHDKCLQKHYTAIIFW